MSADYDTIIKSFNVIFEYGDYRLDAEDVFYKEISLLNDLDLMSKNKIEKLINHHSGNEINSNLKNEVYLELCNSKEFNVIHAASRLTGKESF